MASLNFMPLAWVGRMVIKLAPTPRQKAIRIVRFMLILPSQYIFTARNQEVFPTIPGLHPIFVPWYSTPYSTVPIMVKHTISCHTLHPGPISPFKGNVNPARTGVSGFPRSSLFLEWNPGGSSSIPWSSMAGEGLHGEFRTLRNVPFNCPQAAEISPPRLFLMIHVM